VAGTTSKCFSIIEVTLFERNLIEQKKILGIF